MNTRNHADRIETPAYILANHAGALLSRHDKATDSVVTVYLASDAGVDGGTDLHGKPCRYVTVCETHGGIVGSASKFNARRSLMVPDFCCACSAILEGSR